MKAKIHAVSIAGATRLVWAQTCKGAIRDAVEVLASEASARIATGEELYAAGQAGETIHGEDKYRRMVDPNQQELPLPGDEG